MFVIIGIVIVLVAVLGGFAIEGGPFLVLMQYAEFLIIAGASVGALLISTPGKLLGKIFRDGNLLGGLNRQRSSGDAGVHSY